MTSFQLRHQNYSRPQVHQNPINKLNNVSINSRWGADLYCRSSKGKIFQIFSRYAIDRGGRILQHLSDSTCRLSRTWIPTAAESRWHSTPQFSLDWWVPLLLFSVLTSSQLEWSTAPERSLVHFPNCMSVKSSLSDQRAVEKLCDNLKLRSDK